MQKKPIFKAVISLDDGATLTFENDFDGGYYTVTAIHANAYLSQFVMGKSLLPIFFRSILTIAPLKKDLMTLDYETI